MRIVSRIFTLLMSGSAHGLAIGGFGSGKNIQDALDLLHAAVATFVLVSVDLEDTSSWN
jgi:hypothetical protein